MKYNPVYSIEVRKVGISYTYRPIVCYTEAHVVYKVILALQPQTFGALKPLNLMSCVFYKYPMNTHLTIFKPQNLLQ